MIKTIFLTITATSTLFVAAASMLFSSILGLFGLVTVDADILRDLRASKKIVEKQRSRHDKKSKRIRGKFLAKTGKRVAISAGAAITIGTPLVVVTVAGLEAEDYCDEQKELAEENAILNGAEVLHFDTASCYEIAKRDVLQLAKDIGDSSPAWAQWNAQATNVKNDLISKAEEMGDDVASWWDNSYELSWSGNLWPFNGDSEHE